MKDLPIEQTHELKTVAVLERANPRDVIVLEPKLVTEIKNIFKKGPFMKENLLEEIPTKVVLDALQAFGFRKGIGTVSARRSMLALNIFENPSIFNLRGNVEIQLKRIQNGDYSATFSKSRP